MTVLPGGQGHSREDTISAGVKMGGFLTLFLSALANMESVQVGTSSTEARPKPQKRHGVVLTDKEAFEIYKCKLSWDRCKVKGRSVPVSLKFNVSPKTVRDIWTRRTWTNATKCLWPIEEVICCSASPYFNVGD